MRKLLSNSGMSLSATCAGRQVIVSATLNGVYMKNLAIMVRNRRELSGYAERWVALSPKTRKIIASAKTPKQAILEAQKKGEKDPILTRVPKRFDSYVL